ncbi:MAG: response regulator, partial [Asticcacaulis sp.]
DAGVKVETASDGLAAWQTLQHQPFDLAVVDLDMPRMNGFELIENIRGDTRLKHLPIVVITGREDTVAIDHAYAAGATSFTVKPVRWRLLVHQLAYVLRSSRAEAELRRQLESTQPVRAASVH